MSISADLLDRDGLEPPVIRVRAVRRGYTNESAVISGPHGDAPVCVAGQGHLTINVPT